MKQSHKTLLLWVLLIGIFFWLTELDPNLRNSGVMNAAKVAQGQWWRLFTAIWLHADAAHLAGNAALGLVLLGLAMDGRIYKANGGDILDILGFIGDIGAGGLYIVAKGMGWGQGAIHRATADYGTKYIIVAGLLNVICAVDAFHIAIGKKQ